MTSGTLPTILFLSHSSGLGGGAEQCLYRLLEGFPRERYRPVVVVPGPGKLGRHLAALGIKVVEHPLTWWVGSVRHRDLFCAGLANRVTSLSELIVREGAQVVVTNTSVVMDGALAALHCHLPHVWYVHELLGRNPGLNLAAPPPVYGDLIAQLSSAVVVVSEAVRASLDAFLTSNRVSVLHTGIAPRIPSQPPRSKQDLLGLEPTAPVLLFVGSLCKQKGVLDLLDAASHVLQQCPEARFVLAGSDGGALAEMTALIRKRGITEAVRLVGFRNDIPALLEAANVFVLPSHVDSFPLSVLEAMRAGLPVVATRSGGCEELIVDGETGLLVPVSDPEALAKAMLTLLADAEKRRLFGTRSRERCEQLFSFQRYISDFTQLLDRLMASPPAQPRLEWQSIEALLTSAVDFREQLTHLEQEVTLRRTSRFWGLREFCLRIPGLRQLVLFLIRSYFP